EKDTQNLYVRGYADLPKSFINLDITLEDYPMRIFEYIIEDGISQTVGTTDITAKLHGPMNDLRLSGKGLIKDAGVRINYIGGFYQMLDQEVSITESLIDLTGVELIDEMGNSATITGGLTHKLLGDIKADVRISSPRFIGLNTTEEDNPIYYGLGVGELDMSFRGPFDAVDIRMAAQVENLSQIYIPITNTSYGYDKSFIEFTDDGDRQTKDSTTQESLIDQLKREGVDFEMSLSFTDDAQVYIIYDEATSNLLRGQGEGDIRLRAKRDGEFSVYGDYTVESGDYLYTGYGAIAKAFNILPGGTVIWTGDPINASINVTAKYPTIRVPLTELLREYRDFGSISDEDIDTRQDVDLTLLIGGTLFSPSVNFDIDFPNLVGPVRPIALSKIRTLRATENGINNQVVGLLVFRNFLPDNNPL
ncbi:MAG: translocation/assembly module TamB domain-containing protein, partial [Bacteroidota bacterium]